MWCNKFAKKVEITSHHQILSHFRDWMMTSKGQEQSGSAISHSKGRPQQLLCRQDWYSSAPYNANILESSELDSPPVKKHNILKQGWVLHKIQCKGFFHFALVKVILVSSCQNLPMKYCSQASTFKKFIMKRTWVKGLFHEWGDNFQFLSSKVVFFRSHGHAPQLLVLEVYKECMFYA